MEYWNIGLLTWMLFALEAMKMNGLLGSKTWRGELREPVKNPAHRAGLLPHLPAGRYRVGVV
jgi:hypothetical protein